MLKGIPTIFVLGKNFIMFSFITTVFHSNFHGCNSTHLKNIVFWTFCICGQRICHCFI